jgi:hypothetical protein
MIFIIALLGITVFGFLVYFSGVISSEESEHRYER